MTAIEYEPVARRDITGVILAGGRGSRLGGVDKGFVHLHGRPLIEHVIEVLWPQVGSLVISANRNRDTYASYGFPVIADVMGDYEGPLVGILSAMRAANTTYIVVVPCDNPRPPANLVQGLVTALTEANADVAVASSGGRMQPVFALLHFSLADGLQDYLVQGGHEVGDWMRQQDAVLVDFASPVDGFRNINTREELESMESCAEAGPQASDTKGENTRARNR